MCGDCKTFFFSFALVSGYADVLEQLKSEKDALEEQNRKLRLLLAQTQVNSFDINLTKDSVSLHEKLL